jgi:hypothetical protein
VKIVKFRKQNWKTTSILLLNACKTKSSGKPKQVQRPKYREKLKKKSSRWEETENNREVDIGIWENRMGKGICSGYTQRSITAYELKL